MEEVEPEVGGEGGWGFVGPWDDGEFGELGKELGVTPFGEEGQVVGADEVEEAGVGKLVGVVADGVDGVGDAAAADLLVVDVPGGLAGEGEAQELEADGSRGEFGVLFEGGLGGGDEAEMVEVEFFLGGLSDEDVAEVDGVE